MNLIKSIYIFFLPLALLFIIWQGVMGLFYSTHVLFNSGVLLSALPLLLFLSSLILFKNLARTSEHLFVVSVPSLIGYVVVLTIFFKNANFDYITGMVYAMSAFFMTFLYIYWYSKNNRKISQQLGNNNRLPDFFVFDYGANKVLSRSFIGKDTLIFFYRGNWCPLCMAQIDEVAKDYKKFADINVNIVLIAPQSAENTKTLAEKYDLPFQFYLDKNNVAAKKIGIVHKYGLPMGFQVFGYSSDSVYPTIVAIDDTGKIIYNDQTSNYRLRPEPNELLEVFIK